MNLCSRRIVFNHIYKTQQITLHNKRSIDLNPGFKANLLGTPEKEVDVQAQQKQKNQNTLIYVVAAGIIVIVAVLLFWKKG